MPPASSSASEAHSSPPPAAPAKPPPGWVIGPDGKPCKICTAFRHWKPPVDKAKQPASANGTNGASPSQQKTAAMMAAFASGTGFTQSQSPAQASAATPAEPVRPAHCPPDVEELGRATWTFLHTTAAYFPDAPTQAQRVNMLSLLRALPVLYPCSVCAQHLGENMKTRPPDVSGRVGLSRWLCEQHNEVNERLGKERVECTVERLDERWKDGPGDGSCD